MWWYRPLLITENLSFSIYEVGGRFDPETIQNMVQLLPVFSDILSFFSVIIVAWFGYNQHTKNKLIDSKIDHYKQQLKEKAIKDSESSAIIYGELWRGLHELHTDRVYIIQPHPTHTNRYLTITMEVKKKGVSAMKPNIQALPMSEVANYVSILARERFVNFQDISMEMADKQAKAIMGIAGVLSLSLIRLENTEGKWIGNIVCEHTQNLCSQCGKCQKVLEEMAKIIAPILPDYEG
jgi:hypothetical protein